MRSALKGSFLYPDDTCFYLRKKLAERYGVELENIVAGNGSVELLPLITLTYLDRQEADAFIQRVPEDVLVIMDEA